jgi:hypothetical protein
VQVPSSNVDSIQIVSQGKTLSTISPNSQLLVDAIQQIPTTSYIKNAKLDSALLLTQAREIESLVKECQKLQSDKQHDNWLKTVCSDVVEESVLSLRTEIDRNLNESTATSSPLQITKSSVLSTVDFVGLNLLASPTIQAGGHSFIVKVLPNDARGVLSISSVTQGLNGSVDINKDGTISYKPNPGKPEPDSFTITIQDIEGASIVKTVSIILPCLDNNIGRWSTRF